MVRNHPGSPVDSQIDAYRNARSPDDILSVDYCRWVEEGVFVGTEVYEMLEKRHELSMGIDRLRQRSEPEAEEAMRRLRDWLKVTQDHVLTGVSRIEDSRKFNSVPNTASLRTYVSRAEELLKDWDATLTQANVGWRESELTEVEGEAFVEMIRSGNGKAKFKRPSSTPTE